MKYILVILMGYLLGCSNMAWYLSRLAKADLRSGGSGNLGASNAVVLLGWKAGFLTAVHDVGKSVIAVLLAQWLLPQWELAGAAAGVASVLGHIFPFWLKFKGGKGCASYFGMTLAMNWRFALVILAAFILITIITDFIVSGTLTLVICTPVYLGITQGWLLALILCLGTLVIIFKHRENYPRMLNGTELGLRSAIRGDNKLKK